MDKKTTVTKVQVRITQERLEMLKLRASAEGLSVYNYGGDLLERALSAAQKDSMDQLLAPHIRKAVRFEIDRMLEKMTELMTRVYMEAATSRRLAQASLMLPPQLPRDKVLELAEKNWDAAFKDLQHDFKLIGDWRRQVLGESISQTDRDEAIPDMTTSEEV